MSDLGKIFAAVASALLIIAGGVFGLGDWSIFGPPPESVAEGFVRQVVAGRYQRALPYLSEAVAEKTTAASLRQLKEELESRSGKILNVQGAMERRNGSDAEAAARLQTRNGTFSLRFEMTRSNGVWSIDRWNLS
jgi:hypothetical protein